MNPTTIRVQRRRHLLGLFVVLASVYMLTYSARIETGDTRLFFDAVSSLVDHGDFLIDGSASIRPPLVFDPLNSYPLRSVDTEPMQIITAAPLYWLAKIIQGIGLVHTVWLFNSIVAALTACILYLYALDLKHDPRTALLAALLLGTGTILLPYTRTFFREPLAGFFLLFCLWMLERLRTSDYRERRAWLGLLIGLAAMILTKASMLLALPALMIAALPALRGISRRVVVAGSVLIMGAVLLTAVFSILPVAGDRYDVFSRFLGASTEFFATAVQAYLLSPGGSFWGTSPILLLSFAGIFMLLRRSEMRYPLVLLVLTLAFAFGYAYLNGPHWFGGLSWPPRFLVPIVAVWMLAALPILETITSRRSLWTASVVIIVLYSLWVQLSGVSFDLGAYPENLPPESAGFIEWSGGLYQPSWFRWAVLPSLWGDRPLDFAWATLNLPAIPILYSLLAIIAALYLWRGSLVRYLGALLAVAWIILTFIFLQTLYDSDFRYGATDQAAFDGLSRLEELSSSNDIILLSNPRYEDFFHNYGKWNEAGRVVSLPLQPGEQSSPEQPALIAAEYPPALLNRYTVSLLHSLAAAHERLWLVVDGTPDLWWNVRPVERFLSAFYYPVSVTQVGDFFRIVEYSTVSAPDPYSFTMAENVTDLVFGEAIHLSGFTMPVGRTYRAGEVVPISLLWYAETSLDHRYTMAVYLRSSDGFPVVQNDGQPGGGFYPTDSWRIGTPVWDHRALRLPDALGAGEYQLWVKVYWFAPDQSIRDLDVTEGDSIDEVIGVLPITITIVE